MLNKILSVGLGGLVIYCFGITPGTLAQSIPRNDCSLAQAYETQVRKDSSFDLSTIDDLASVEEAGHYPVEAISLAFDNLRSYCCFGAKELGDDFCTTANRDLQAIPASPFLFDHLIDIGLRRLDADEETVYGSAAIIDPQGKEWRDAIREDATAINGKSPEAIYRGYTQHWGTDIAENIYRFTARDNGNACDFFTLSPSRPLTLTDKYSMQCDIAWCHYRELTQNNHFNYPISDVTYRLETGYMGCKDMVHERILNELDYVQATMVSQGNQFVLHNTQQHTSTYFVGSRLSRLLTKRSKQLNWWEIVNRKVVEGTAECSI